jgi:hypothetical protein
MDIRARVRCLHAALAHELIKLGLVLGSSEALQEFLKLALLLL